MAEGETSKRKRTPRVLDSPVAEKPDVSRVWTHEDRCNLLKGLRTYGHTDIDGIAALLPNKTKPAIRLMIYKIMQKSRVMSQQKSPALNAWLASGTFDNRTPIPEALRYISMFEKHPTPEESGGFDFSVAYNYLYRMTVGLPAADLPPATLDTLNALVREVYAEVWPAANDDVISYLSKLGPHKVAAPKCYPPQNRLHGIKNDFWFSAEEENAE